MAAPIGLPFGEEATDTCLDGIENGCGNLTMEDVVEEKLLNTTYTFFGQSSFQSVFVSFSKYFDFDIKAATIIGV